jgi:hypothetical protein
VSVPAARGNPQAVPTAGQHPHLTGPPVGTPGHGGGYGLTAARPGGGTAGRARRHGDTPGQARPADGNAPGPAPAPSTFGPRPPAHGPVRHASLGPEGPEGLAPEPVLRPTR